MSGIPKKLGWYPDEKRIEVATLYAALGNPVRINELTAVPVSTIKSWAREDWFKALLEEIRGENNEALDSKFTEIVHKAQDLVLDRLEHGDYFANRDGIVYRKPVNIRDLALVSAITVDKRQIIRNKPTTITQGAVSEGDKLEKLKDFFVDLVNKGKKQEKIIEDVEFTEVTDNVGEPAPESEAAGTEEEQAICQAAPTT